MIPRDKRAIASDRIFCKPASLVNLGAIFSVGTKLRFIIVATFSTDILQFSLEK